VGWKSKKINEASQEGKKGNVKNTKRCEGIRGDCPGPTQVTSATT